MFWSRGEVSVLAVFLIGLHCSQNISLINCITQTTNGLLWKLPQDNPNLGFRAMEYQTVPAPYYCLMRCGATCYAIGYNHNLTVNNCVLLTNLPLPSASGDVWIGDKGWGIFFKSGVSMEFLAFRASSGTAHNTYAFYETSTVSELQQMPSAYDLSKPLTKPFKHFTLEEWNKWNIRKVVLQMWKDGSPAVDMAFDPTQGGKMDWFKYKHLLSSPWGDMLPDGSSTNVQFAILSNEERSFYSKRYGGSCDDGGWTVIVDGKDYCNWGRFSSYPQFLYASLNMAAKWGGSAMRKADDFIILLEGYTSLEKHIFAGQDDYITKYM